MNPSHLKYHLNKYKYAKMYYTIIKRYLSVLWWYWHERKQETVPTPCKERFSCLFAAFNEKRNFAIKSMSRVATLMYHVRLSRSIQFRPQSCKCSTKCCAVEIFDVSNVIPARLHLQPYRLPRLSGFSNSVELLRRPPPPKRTDW